MIEGIRVRSPWRDLYETFQDQAKKLGTKIGISNKTCSELSALTKSQERNALVNKVAGWQGASAGLRSYGLCDNRGEAGAAPWVWQRAFVRLLVPEGLLVKALHFWFFLSRKPTERSSLRPMDTNNISIKNKAQPARRQWSKHLNVSY